MMFSVGVAGHGAVTLETVNPKSRTLLTLPLVVTRYEGDEYAVSMLGQGSRWVRNVRAAGGKAVIHAGRRRSVLLEVDLGGRTGRAEWRRNECHPSILAPGGWRSSWRRSRGRGVP